MEHPLFDISEMHQRLLRFVDRRTDALFANLAKACEEGGVDPIHDVRTACRRLTEPLRLLEVEGRRKKIRRIRRRVRALREAFQRVRDLDVMLASLADSPGKARADEAQALAPVIEAMRQDRERECKRAVACAQRRKFSRLRRRLLRLGRRRSRDLPARQLTLAGRLESLVRNRRDELSAHTSSMDRGTGDPHQLRIAVKRYRYVLELANYLQDSVPQQALDFLKQAQDALGHWHDEFVLAQELSQRCFALPEMARDPAAATVLLQMAKLRMQTAGKELARFAALWKDSNQVLPE